MKIVISRSLILTVIVVAALVIATPFAVAEFVRTGELYMISRRFIDDMVARLYGPGRLRFILQPTVAIVLGVRDGIKDARAGNPPFLWAFAFHSGERRRLLRGALASIRDLVAIAILLDMLAQFLMFRLVRPSAALLLGPLLIAFPYASARALANRATRRRKDHLFVSNVESGAKAGERRIPLPEWTIPFWYAVGSLLAGLMLPRIEHGLLPEAVSSVSVPVALTLFSSITSGMIALTGIVFSLAFVMVQFSAIAYSPRLVLWLSRDPVIWHSLGMFTATFLYTIGAIAWIDRESSGKVPFFSGWLVIILMLASVVMLIALIQRVGLLRIDRMLAFTGNLGRRAIERTYPPLETPASLARPDELVGCAITQTVLYSGEPQALRSINTSSLLALAAHTGGCVKVASCVGDTLIAGVPLLSILGGARAIEGDASRRAFETGPDRSLDQDPKYALRLLADIAIKALSPAINDPTTAVQALDQIQDLLLHLGLRRLEIGAVRDDKGITRVIVPHPTWDDFLRLGLEEIRFYGSTSVQVMRRMRAIISDLVAALPQERHPALRQYLERLNATIARSFMDEEEKLEASVEDRQGLGAPELSRQMLEGRQTIER